MDDTPNIAIAIAAKKHEPWGAEPNTGNPWAIISSLCLRVTQQARLGSRHNVYSISLIQGWLEAALGDDAKFEPLLQESQADERVRQVEAVAIASQFYGQTRKGTTRPKALDRVRERQVKLMEFKRQPSTSGRPAA